jgi:hypothetical protein
MRINQTKLLRQFIGAAMTLSLSFAVLPGAAHAVPQDLAPVTATETVATVETVTVADKPDTVKDEPVSVSVATLTSAENLSNGSKPDDGADNSTDFGFAQRRTNVIIVVPAAGSLTTESLAVLTAKCSNLLQFFSTRNTEERCSIF